MELELGLKITKTKDDIGSISEYQFMKDAGPVFHSRETNTMFILTANLKGYKRNNIDIKISKDGSKISINGKKPIQEMVMMGWVMQRKVVDVKGFNKVFKIPHGVNLDKIKANYNEEEWMMNIVMPKLVKGICGLKIEEFKEQYFDKGKSHLEKSEIDHVSSSVGETSQKRTKDSEFQHMEGSENVIEKVLDDDTNKKFNKETIQREVGEPKLRVEDGNGEIRNGIDDVTKDIGEKDLKEKELSNLRVEDSKVKDIGEKDGKERHEALKTLEKMEKMPNETKKDRNEETIEKEVGDSKLRIKNGNGESAGEKDGKDEYEVTKTSERDQGLGVPISNKLEDTRKDKEFEDQKMDISSANKRHDDVNRDMIGGTIKEKEESNLRSEDSKVKDIGKGISHNIVDTSQRVFEETMIQQCGESKQKESKEHFEESEKENSLEPFEAMKVLEKFPFEANHDFQEEMTNPKKKTKDGDQECVLEKLGGKEEFDDGMVTTKKEFPKHLHKSISKEEGESNVEKMQETKNVKEEMVNKEVEYFVEKGEGERFERMHVEEKKENNTKETMREKIEESENVLKKRGSEQFAGIEGSKGFNFENEEEQNMVSKEALIENESLIKGGGEYKNKTKIRQEKEDMDEYSIVKLKGDGSIKMGENELKERGHEMFTGTEGSKGFNFANEEQNEVTNDALVKDESLIMEGGEYKKKTQEIVQDEDDKNKHSIVRWKGEGCTNMHVEPNELFEGENVNNGLFDGRKTQKFQEIEQTEDEYVNEEGANIEKSKKKVNRDKYEKLQNEENEGFHKNITKKKYERVLQEETSNGISKASNVAKVFPKEMLDSSVDTKKGRNNKSIEKTKVIKESVKESSMEPFEAMKVSKLETFEANDDDYKDFRRPKRETKDEEPNGNNSNKEGFDGKMTISEGFSKNVPKCSHEGSEGMNVLKMQETKDVKENVVEGKGREIEYFKEKDEGDDRLKSMDVEEMKVNNTRETMQEEIEKSENGIKGGGQHDAKIEGSKVFNVANEDEVEDKEESKKRSNSTEQDEESISHNIVDSGQRVYEESLIQHSGESKQKEVGGTKYDSKERLNEVLKESMEQNVVNHIHRNIGCINQNEYREPRVLQMEKTKSTKEKKNGGMDSEKTHFEVNEDVQKTLFRDVGQKEVVKINEEFPKNLPKSSFDESEGLNVQKIQESKNVKEEMVDKEIEYFKEKGEGERFKRMHVKTKKGNTRETMHEEIEKNENEIKESGQQHAKENTANEMDEVSKNVTRELKQKVADIDESKGFNVAKEEEEKEVTKKALVESESLMEKVEGKQSKERTKAKIVQDGGPAKIHVDRRSFQEKEESKYVNEKGEKIVTFGKKVDNKKQNEEDEDFKKGLTEGKDYYLPNNASERRSLDTKDAKEGFSMKMLDSQIDTREELNDRKIEKMKGLNENENVVLIVKKVKLQEEEIKERTKAIVQDEGDKIEYGLVKLKGEGSTKITHKFQEKEEIEDVNEKGEKTEEFVNQVNEKMQNEEDKGFKKNTTKERDERFWQEEMSEGRSKASKAANEPFDDRSEKEIRNHKLESFDEFIEKENVGIGIVDGRKTQKFQVMNQTQDAKEKGANNEKTTKKMNRNKEVSEKVEQVEANEGLRNDIEEQNFGESMTKEELHEFDMERIRTPERESHSVVSIGFKEFGYENPKDKKLKTKVLDTKFESNERYETKDESMNQEVSGPKKPKVGQNCTRNKVGETFQEKTDEPKKKIDDREQENAARDDGKVETEEKDMFKEYKITQNVTGEKCKIDGEIAKSGIEKVDRKKWIHETMKTTREKERSKKEEESSDERLKNDVAEMKTKRDYEQQEYVVEEVNAPKTATYEGAKLSEYVIEEHETTKEFSPKNVEKGKVVKKREGLKVADSEETKDDSTLTTTKIKEDKKPKMKEKTSQFDKASGSKMVAEKVHETLKREHKSKSEESTKHELTVAPNTTNEIPKVEELQEEKEEERYINVPDMTISKEGIQITTTHSKEKEIVEPKDEVDKLQENQIPSPKEPFHCKESTTALEVAADKVALKRESEEATSKTPTKKVERKESHESTKPPKMDTEIPKVIEFRKQKDDRDRQYLQEKNDKKGFQTPKTVEAEKVAKSEKENKTKMEEITPQSEFASGSKRVSEKVHDDQRNSEELTRTPNNNETPKVEELQDEKEGERSILALEATFSKEDEAQDKATHAKEKVAQQSKVPSTLSTQQLQVEGAEKTNNKEDEQCINKDDETKLGIQEIEEEKDYEQVHEEQKEDKDETYGEKKNNAKISKKLLVPLVIAGSALLASVVFIFVRHRRSRKM